MTFVADQKLSRQEIPYPRNFLSVKMRLHQCAHINK